MKQARANAVSATTANGAAYGATVIGAADGVAHGTATNAHVGAVA
jgi:hypothetical protein